MRWPIGANGEFSIKDAYLTDLKARFSRTKINFTLHTEKSYGDTRFMKDLSWLFGRSFGICYQKAEFLDSDYIRRLPHARYALYNLKQSKHILLCYPFSRILWANLWRSLRIAYHERISTVKWVKLILGIHNSLRISLNIQQTLLDNILCMSFT